jgi:adenine-specific DNA-methyltransferase
MFLSEGRGLTPINFWPHEYAGNTDDGTRDLSGLIPGKVFDNPKPVALVRRCIEHSCDESSLILDFFAGSSVTADATLELNAEDSGERRCILVQLPEPCSPSSEAFKQGFRTIADIGKERVRRVIRRIADRGPPVDGNGKELSQDSIAGNAMGVRVFRLDASNFFPWDADLDTLEPSLLDAVENIKTDRTELDILHELLLKYGLDLAIPVEQREIAGKTVYVVGAGALIVCLADGVTLEVAEGIAALKAELQPEITRVVFKDAGFPNDVVKTNTVQILRQAGIDDVKSL